MPKLLAFISIIIFSLVACSTSPQAIETAIAQTKTAQPTATLTPKPTLTPTPLVTSTSTPIPYASLDLSPYLALSSDLPTGYTGGQITLSRFEMFNNLSPAEYTISQDLQRNGEKNGGINVLVFSSPEKAQQVFDAIQKKLGEDAKEAVSDDGAIKIGYTVLYLASLGAADLVDMQVLHCNTIYFARVTNTSSVKQVSSYLGAVYHRTKKLIYCPKETLFPTSTPQ